MKDLLHLSHLSIAFGGLMAVDDLDMEVHAGEIVSLIGPNGAGKSTVFNLVTGLYKPTSGTIIFDRERIDILPAYRITGKGMARTFQNIRLFRDLSVLENTQIGAHTFGSAGVLRSLIPFWGTRREEAHILGIAHTSLELVGLTGKEQERARNLPYGGQRRLEIARALSAEPKLLLLDEPAAGMNPQEKDELAEIVRAIRGRGVTIFLVEHDMRFVMNLSDRIVVLDYGRKIAEGTPDEVRHNPAVIAAYLGERK